jgi:hypothetical protein
MFSADRKPALHVVRRGFPASPWASPSDPGADPCTGDSARILMQMPDEAAARGRRLRDAGAEHLWRADVLPVDRPDKAFQYTIKRNTVAVIPRPTAVVRICPTISRASMPAIHVFDGAVGRAAVGGELPQWSLLTLRVACTTMLYLR